jgi:tetratricopeptide (TPR) repeat protein
MPHEPSPQDNLRTDRLDSWKDIAAYLQRDVTTVQRWEKREGMPVHRHVHEKLGSIYAFRSELDSWSRSRAMRSQAPDAVVPPNTAADSAIASLTSDPASGETARRAALNLPYRLAGVAAIVLVVIALVVLFARMRSTNGASQGAASSPAGQAASDALLRARYLSVRTTDADNRAAIALLERAIALDADFAAAYAELAAALVTRLAYVTPEETRDLEERAFAAAEKALSLDPNVPEAYIARGDLLWSHSHRFAHERAVQEFRRALALNPNSNVAHRRLARVFVHVGFFDEAIHHAGIALTLNPSDSQALNSRAQALLWQGNDREALEILQSIPGPVLPELVDANVAFALLRLGRRDEAAARLAEAMRKHPDDASGGLPAMQALLLADSAPQQSSALLAGLSTRKAVNPSHHASYFAACALARMRRPADAVRWLREAAETGFPCYTLFARDPLLDPIRSSPEFVAFMADLKTRVASLRTTLFPESPQPPR